MWLAILCISLWRFSRTLRLMPSRRPLRTIWITADHMGWHTRNLPDQQAHAPTRFVSESTPAPSISTRAMGL